MFEVSISNDTSSHMAWEDSEPRRLPGSAESSEPVQRRSNVGAILVDSPNLIRAALGHMIQAQPDLDVVLEASSADECIVGFRRIRRRTANGARLRLAAEPEPVSQPAKAPRPRPRR